MWRDGESKYSKMRVLIGFMCRLCGSWLDFHLPETHWCFSVEVKGGAFSLGRQQDSRANHRLSPSPGGSAVGTAVPEARGPGLYASSLTSHWMWATLGMGSQGWAEGLGFPCGRVQPSRGMDVSFLQRVLGGSPQHPVHSFSLWCVCLSESHSYTCLVVLQGYSFVKCVCSVLFH